MSMRDNSLIDRQSDIILRPATLDDLNLLFYWANDSEVRNNSFTTRQITLEEHTTWYKNIMERTDVAIYIMVCQGVNVGQVRIKMKDNEAEISYSIAKEFRCMGYGKKLISLLTDRIKTEFPHIKKLIAQVKPENKGSCKVFAENGYEKKAVVYELEFI